MAIPNGDGTGLGWYGCRSEPALFRSIVPAWGDENLVELAAEIRSPLFLAHVRAGTGTPVQQTIPGRSTSGSETTARAPGLKCEDRSFSGYSIRSDVASSLTFGQS
jgi:hypothetical protein